VVAANRNTPSSDVPGARGWLSVLSMCVSGFIAGAASRLRSRSSTARSSPRWARRTCPRSSSSKVSSASSGVPAASCGTMSRRGEELSVPVARLAEPVGVEQGPVAGSPGDGGLLEVVPEAEGQPCGYVEVGGRPAAGDEDGRRVSAAGQRDRSGAELDEERGARRGLQARVRDRTPVQADPDRVPERPDADHRRGPTAQALRLLGRRGGPDRRGGRVCAGPGRQEKRWGQPSRWVWPAWSSSWASSVHSPAFRGSWSPWCSQIAAVDLFDLQDRDREMVGVGAANLAADFLQRIPSRPPPIRRHPPVRRAPQIRWPPPSSDARRHDRTVTSRTGLAELHRLLGQPTAGTVMSRLRCHGCGSRRRTRRAIPARP
jgi:hypothetical protein